MKVPCPACQTSYTIPDAKVPDKPFKIKCRKCQTVIRIDPSSSAVTGESGGSAGHTQATPRQPARMAPDLTIADRILEIVHDKTDPRRKKLLGSAAALVVFFVPACFSWGLSGLLIVPVWGAFAVGMSCFHESKWVIVGASFLATALFYVPVTLILKIF